MVPRWGVGSQTFTPSREYWIRMEINDNIEEPVVLQGIIHIKELDLRSVEN